uniref:P-loop NTPase fold protein n=1 Tax=Candidatus Cryptobacteroides bacterium TaxID=3085639 RepID=UPI004028584B
MNELISKYLSDYLHNPDPQYAVMLKGKWGCGKSFFVNKWIKEYTPAGKKKSLEPIYVSLYGLKDTSQITEAIDRVLHPLLYSKGAELTKKLLGIAGKVVLKTSFDVNKDGNENISLDATLDSVSLLLSKDNIIGNKLIIFDDLERCLIDMKLLLGYINSFVEHGSCHVILVGDETRVVSRWKKTLIEFKEKTVGREFEIMPDVDDAITCFLHGYIPSDEWLQNQKTLNTDIFHATECNNLRILRQCLYDFNGLYVEVRDSIEENDEPFMQSLLASYIVVYCEYRGKCHDLFSQWEWSYDAGIAGNNEMKERISALCQKYKSVEGKHNLDVLNTNHITNIVRWIELGHGLNTYVKETLGMMRHNTTHLEKLANFWDMPLEVFKTECSALEQDVVDNAFPNIFLLGRSLAFLAFFDHKSLFWMKQAVVSLAKKHVKESYTKQSTKEELYEQRNQFIQGLNSFGRFRETVVGADVIKYTDGVFNDCDKNLKNKFERVLSHITDDNVGQLLGLSQEPTPDKQCPYNLTSVFKNIEVEDLFNSVCNLSNKSLNILSSFLSLHYGFSYCLGNGSNRFSDDYTVLLGLKSKLDDEYKKSKSIDRYVLRDFIKNLEGAIKRDSVYNEAIDV